MPAIWHDVEVHARGVHGWTCENDDVRMLHGQGVESN